MNNKIKVNKEIMKKAINRINFEQMQLIADRTGISFKEVFDVLKEAKNHIKAYEGVVE